VTHLGQRLSALIDGELEASERTHVLLHMSKCGSCRDEVAELRMLKRRMNSLGEAAADAGLVGRLMSELMGLDESKFAGAESRFAGGMSAGESAWPPPPPPGGWPVNARSSQGATSADRDGHPDQRAGRLFLAGSVAIFLAGLGTAAVIAGGEPQARAPAPPVTPSVDVLVAPNNAGNQGLTGGSGSHGLESESRDRWARPLAGITYLPIQP
jgi:anti-sigma factor RsiW